MDKKSALDIVTRFRKAVESRGIAVNKLILYGSYARGDYREGSDIDLILISEDFKSTITGQESTFCQKPFTKFSLRLKWSALHRKNGPAKPLLFLTLPSRAKFYSPHEGQPNWLRRRNIR